MLDCLSFFLSDFEKLHMIEVDGVAYLEFDSLGADLFVTIASSYAAFIVGILLDCLVFYLAIRVGEKLADSTWSFLKRSFSLFKNNKCNQPPIADE